MNKNLTRIEPCIYQVHCKTKPDYYLIRVEKFSDHRAANLEEAQVIKATLKVKREAEKPKTYAPVSGLVQWGYL